MSELIARDFFRRDPVTCARELIGCELVWNDCAGIVVETEAYAAVGDEACHTFMRPSARAFVASHRAGAAYVYMNYGVHWLLNVLIKGNEIGSVENSGNPSKNDGFVLIRALEPTRGIEKMRERRSLVDLKNVKKNAHPLRALCTGPGRLAQALGVRGADHGRDLCADENVGFLPRENPVKIARDIRIGISKAAHLRWRFLLKNSLFISVVPKKTT